MSELIVVVDSEFDACQLAKHCLEEVGYRVLTFASTADFDATQTPRPALMLIGATLPDSSGLWLCRRIRRHPVLSTTAIILLISGSAEDQGCAALEAGADHYLTKPFSSRELKARVQAALRHVGRRSPAGPADIVIDHGAMTVSVRGSEISTTTLEFRLVNYLARHRGHAFTRDVLLDAVWGDAHFVTPRSVDACIRRVREKIEPDATRPVYLKTVRGVGYRFDGVAVWPISSEICSCAVCRPTNGRDGKTEVSKFSAKRAAS
jgi:two-component system phosphate regulon response regulator PhoB